MRKLIGGLFALCLIIALLEKAAPFLLIGGAIYGAYRYKKYQADKEAQAELMQTELDIASYQREIVENAYKILDDKDATESQKQQAKSILKDKDFASAKSVVDMMSLSSKPKETDDWDNF